VGFWRIVEKRTSDQAKVIPKTNDLFPQPSLIKLYSSRLLRRSVQQ